MTKRQQLFRYLQFIVVYAALIALTHILNLPDWAAALVLLGLVIATGAYCFIRLKRSLKQD